MARTPFKLKSGNKMTGSSFKMMGSSSPAKRAGNWIIGDDGIPVQVSTDVYRAHQKKGDVLLEEMQGDSQNIGLGMTEAEREAERLREEKASEDRLKHVYVKGDEGELEERAYTTGQESMDALRVQFRKAQSAGEKDIHGAKYKSFADWVRYNPDKDIQAQVNIADREIKEEAKTGVAEKQIELDE